MAVHRQQEKAMTTAKKDRIPKNKKKDAAAANDKNDQEDKAALVEEHLPPLALVWIVLFCSGTLFVFAIRDFLTTGRNIGGAWDEAMLVRKIVSKIR